MGIYSRKCLKLYTYRDSVTICIYIYMCVCVSMMTCRYQMPPQCGATSIFEEEIALIFGIQNHCRLVSKYSSDHLLPCTSFLKSNLEVKFHHLLY